MKPLDATRFNSLNGAPSFSLRNRAFRFFWMSTWFLLASWTPPFFKKWRRLLLVLFGAKIGKNSDVRGSARVWYPPNLVMGTQSVLAENVKCYNQGMIMIGSRSIISQHAYLCSSGHDIDDSNFQLVVTPIFIGNGAWVASNAFVGPGAVIGDGAVLGACAVSCGKLEPDTIYIGNPARPTRKRKIRIYE